jgi:hypothetical protein
MSNLKKKDLIKDITSLLKKFTVSTTPEPSSKDYQGSNHDSRPDNKSRDTIHRKSDLKHHPHNIVESNFPINFTNDVLYASPLVQPLTPLVYVEHLNTSANYLLLELLTIVSPYVDPRYTSSLFNNYSTYHELLGIVIYSLNDPQTLSKIPTLLLQRINELLALLSDLMMRTTVVRTFTVLDYSQKLTTLPKILGKKPIKLKFDDDDDDDDYENFKNDEDDDDDSDSEKEYKRFIKNIFSK